MPPYLSKKGCGGAASYPLPVDDKGENYIMSKKLNEKALDNPKFHRLMINTFWMVVYTFFREAVGGPNA